MTIASEIYINSQGRQWGPYSAKEAGFLLAKGAFQSADWAWSPGAGQWKPLAAVLEAIQPEEQSVMAEVVKPPSVKPVLAKVAPVKQKSIVKRWASGKMKYAAAVVVVLGAFFVFQGGEEANYEQLNRRDGIAYSPDSQEPFEGRAVSYYPNGKPMYSAVFKGGKEEKVVSWYDNGQKQSEGSMKSGKFHGQVRYWYENGKLMANYTYENGHVLKRQDWDPDGNMYKRK